MTEDVIIIILPFHPLSEFQQDLFKGINQQYLFHSIQFKVSILFQ